MRLLYNPSHTRGSRRSWKGFLIGSLIMTAFIILAITENELVFLGMVGFILVGIVLFIDNLINPHEEVAFFTTLIFFVLGIIVSLLLSVVGLQYLYLLVTIVLIILTYAPGKKIWKKRK